MTHLDTQVVIWLAAKKLNQLSSKARKLIGRLDELTISPNVLVEIEILIEIKRINAVSALGMYEALSREIDLKLSAAPAEDVARTACTFAWTRDPFDRLIVANAMADGAKLITADEIIRANFRDAVW